MSSPENPGAVTTEEDALRAAEELDTARQTILKELHKVIVGQQQVIEETLLAILGKGHCLLVGVPGLAKTLLVKSLARTLDLKFNRIQFTPDLMPSDITGTNVIEEDMSTGHRSFEFIRGPIFANVILADEINRTPPKTQAALLEAMQEERVTAGGVTHSLEPPFFVLATQNPIEQEGTYPLPEAQLDRFMFNIYINYPEDDEEEEIYRRTTDVHEPEVDTVISGETITGLQKLVRQVPLSDYIIKYVRALTTATRPSHDSASDFVKTYVSWGAGPRAGQHLILGAKARALSYGRLNVTPEDVRAISPSVLRHRIGVNFNAEAEGIDSLQVVQSILKNVSEPDEKEF